MLQQGLLLHPAESLNITNDQVNSKVRVNKKATNLQTLLASCHQQWLVNVPSILRASPALCRSLLSADLPCQLVVSKKWTNISIQWIPKRKSRSTHLPLVSFRHFLLFIARLPLFMFIFKCLQESKRESILNRSGHQRDHASIWAKTIQSRDERSLLESQFGVPRCKVSSVTGNNDGRRVEGFQNFFCILPLSIKLEPESQIKSLETNRRSYNQRTLAPIMLNLAPIRILPFLAALAKA